MDLLPLHIEYLLTRHACVIVPGVGAFIVTEKESSFDPEAGIVMPRRREISFNSSVITDDGLLSHSIARREHLPYEAAHRMLNAMIEKLKADLQAEGEASIGLVGRLVRDEEGLVSFMPKGERAAAEVYREERLRRAAAPVAAASTSAGPAISAEVADSDAPESSEATSAAGLRSISVPADRYVFTIKKKVAHIAAMFALVLTIGLSLLLPVNHTGEQKAAVISIEKILRTFKVGSDKPDAAAAAASVAVKKDERKNK